MMKYYFYTLLCLLAKDAFSQEISVSQKITAYIQKPLLDSISKENLLQEKTIQLSDSNFKLLTAVAYFHDGVSFKNVQSQHISKGNLNWLSRLDSVQEAKTPFKVTIADIWCSDPKGKKYLADEFTIIVY